VKALVCNQYGPPESLVIEDQHLADPGKGEVLVDIKAAGINFPDVLMIAGKYQVKSPLPFVPGSEAAGVISSVGDGVSRYAAGDRVIILPEGGAFAEQCVVHESRCLPMPESMSFEQAAGFTVAYATSYHALRQSTELKAGETILVLGAAGGVGTTAVEIANALGARVIAAASSDQKLDFARAAGADETINYDSQNLKETVKELTNGKGVDVVYDPVGGELAEQAYRCLARHGRYLVIGFASGEIPKFAVNIALLKEASIIGVWWGPWTARNPGLAAQNMSELTEMVAGGKLNPRVSEIYRLDQYVEAFASITGRKAMGKVIFTVG